MTNLCSPARRAFPATLFAVSLALAAPSNAAPNSYDITYLDADVSGVASHTDPNLVNGWGVAFNPNGFVWVADNHSGKATLYDGNGNVQSLVVTIPPISGTGTGSPTGIVFNGSNDFAIVTGTPTPTTAAPARFIFASEDGLLSGWAPGLTTAVAAASNPNAVYKGIALAGNGTSNQLYAADFGGRKIDVYSATFAPVTVPGGFTDAAIPATYGPFNITNIQGNLYVAYAKVKAGSTDEQAGPGLGFVDVFDADGFLLRRVVSHGLLNAPWGMALAPEGFGRFSNTLLVGNFGDGTINAFELPMGNFMGKLRTSDGQVLRIDGLWGLGFGNGIQSQPTDTLFFAAGPDDENHGLYGRIDFNQKSSPGQNEGD